MYRPRKYFASKTSEGFSNDSAVWANLRNRVALVELRRPDATNAGTGPVAKNNKGSAAYRLYVPQMYLPQILPFATENRYNTKQFHLTPLSQNHLTLRWCCIYLKVCYARSALSSAAEYGSTGHGCQSCSWSAMHRRVITFSPLSPFAPENLASRDGFSPPVPRQPARSPISC